MKRSGGSYSSHCETQKMKDSPDGESLPLVLFAVMTLLEKPTGGNFNEFSIIYTIFTLFVLIEKSVLTREMSPPASRQAVLCLYFTAHYQVKREVSYW